MKVKCQKCGKMFDYDVYSGQCPKCSTYYGIKVQPYTSENAKTPSRWKLKNGHSRIVRDGLLIAIGLVAIFGVIESNKASKAAYEGRFIASEITIKEAKQGKPFIYTGDETYEITIMDAVVDTGKEIEKEVPRGFHLISVSYRVKPENQESQESTYDDIQMKPYLLTKDGEYLTPVDAEWIKDRKEYSSDSETAEIVSNGFKYANGKLYYLIKTNDPVGMVISSFSNRKHGDVPKGALKERYHITNLEVKEA